MKSARVLLKPTATCLPDVMQQRNISGNPTNGHKLNLSTSAYLFPFQEEQKSAKQSRRVIKRFLSGTLLKQMEPRTSRTEYKMPTELFKSTSAKLALGV